MQGALGEMLEDAERDRRQEMKDAEVWLDWYDAKPLQSERNDPWPGASNIVAGCAVFGNRKPAQALRRIRAAAAAGWRRRKPAGET